MTQRDDIGAQLDAALHAAFPSGDVGYPQTPRTKRARAIMETAIALAGAQIEVYNFHECPDCVQFNVRYGGGWVTAAAISFKNLDALTNAALIQQWIPRVLEYGHGDSGVKATE